MKKIRFFAVVVVALCSAGSLKAQDDGGRSEFNPVTVSVPSLTIAPDARGGSMGDLGAATEPDMASQYWNPAKYAFATSKAGAMLSYTPWLRSLVNDIDLVFLSGFYKLGDDDLQALSASIRYFSMGYVEITDAVGTKISSTNPYEMAMDFGYSRKLTEKFSMGVTGRFILSDMGGGVVEELYPGYAVAADVAGYYRTPIDFDRNEGSLGLGFNISNIGTKISYDEQNTSYFIPTNLRIGASLLYPMDDYNDISFSVEAAKYLVPTPPELLEGSSADVQQHNADALKKYRDMSSMTGIFTSFSDAPGGLKEELQEIMFSAGAEYTYNKQFMVRGGYFYESPNKGNRQYFSVGAGFKLSAFQLDVAYLISTVPSNPLDQTLRFSLIFDADGLRNLVR